jgi:hypothetical protein
MKWKGKEIPAWAVKWGLIALCVGVALFYLWGAKDSIRSWVSGPPPPASQAAEPREIRTIERIYIPGPERIRTIEKVKYIEKLPGSLTPATMADNSAHVIASAKIPPSPAGGTASAILRIQDGVGTGTIEYKPATPPFFAIQKEFGIRAGMGTGGLVLGELYARPVRVGPVTVEIRGFGKRDDRSGADFGAAILGDMRF